MRILCLGAGAVGGYFGGRLVEGGSQVDFLVRGRRQAQLAKDGLLIESSFGNARLAVNCLIAEECEGPYDLILLTCKAYDLRGAIGTIYPFVGTKTTILPLLNGVAHIDILNEWFGREHVLGGVAKIQATLDANGVIKHLNDWRYITIGEQDGSESARAAALAAAFDQQSVVATVVPNIMQRMWEKVVHLSTVAGMTCVMRASVGEIARTEAGSSLMIELLERNATIAIREGFRPSEEFLDEYKELFQNTSSNYKASMLRDIERHGPVEADHILGFMLKKAEQHSIDPSMHRFIVTHLQAYEAGRAAAAGIAEAA